MARSFGPCLNRMPWVLLAVALFSGPSPADADVFPGKEWATRAPARAGLDPTRLDAFRDLVGGRGCVARGGYLVYSWGDVARRGDVASAAKPWYVHFLLLLLERGTIRGLDEPVRVWEPRLDELNPGLGFQDRKISWRHLANQTSCYGVEEAPGVAYDYSDYNMALLVDTLFLRAYQTTYARMDTEVLRPRLTDPLGCQDAPTFLAFGAADRPGRLAISPRDFCRFGLLYLRKGNWDGRRLLEARHAALAVTSPVPNSVPRAGGPRG